MAGTPRVTAATVLQAVTSLQADIQGLTNLLIGCKEEPDKPGLVERVRMVEGAIKLVKWVAGIIMALIVGDVITRLLAWYRGTP